MISRSHSVLLLLSRASQRLQPSLSFSRVIVIYSPAIATISSSLCLFFSCFQLLSCYLCVPLSIFCCVFSSSVLVRVLSSAISCFRATLIAPRLLVVATQSLFPCVFMPQLKRSSFIQNSKCSNQDFKNKGPNRPRP